MNKYPLVTVYIPTFNRVELLERAVQSVREQTYANLEIIIVDDCSTDGTKLYLENLVREDNRVRYFIKEINSGACISRNIAINNAKGEYITGLDDDDYFISDRIEKFIQNIDLLEKYLFLYTENFIKIDNILERPKLSGLKPSVVTAKDLLYSNMIGNQCFIKTEIMRQYGMFSEDLKAWQDMDLWYKLLNTSTKNSAKQLEDVTYVQDISHELGRITTTNRLNKIIDVYNLFCQKNNLNNFEKEVLRGQLASYGVKVDIKIFYKRILSSHYLYIFFKNLYLIRKNISNEYKWH